MKKILISVIMGIGSLSLFAQQDAMFTHYAFNTLAVNPGYAGSRDALTVTGLHRSQWVGFEGAPTTQTVTLHSPVANEKVGLGLSLANDRIGPTNTTSIYVDGAYKIKLTQKGTLSFGLKAGVNLLQGDLNSVDLENQNDNAFQKSVQSDVLPNVGAGLYYSTTKYYVGVSAPKFFENDFKNSTTTRSAAKEQRHYFLIAGTVFDLNESGSLKLKPTGFLKATTAAPLEGDITGMLIVDDKYELGAMFRTGDAAGLLLGYNISNQLRIGYSFDFSYTNTTFKYNGGSHELMVRYDFIYKEKGRVKSPRYF